MDIAKILEKKYPGSVWVLDGDAYSGLTWSSETPKPSEEELQNQWADVKYQAQYEAVIFARQNAYQQTADPLFFKFQAGEATEQEWLAARQEVVDANPYPAKSK